MWTPSANPVHGLFRGRIKDPWSEVVPGRLPAELTERLRRVIFHHCQSSGARRCVLIASPKLCKTFQPPRRESDWGAFEAAVHVLSDAHVQPFGTKMLCSTCHPDDRTISVHQATAAGLAGSREADGSITDRMLRRQRTVEDRDERRDCRTRRSASQ